MTEVNIPLAHLKATSTTMYIIHKVFPGSIAEEIIKGFVLGVILLGPLLVIEALGTYLTIKQGTISLRSFIYWYKKIPIRSVIRITKEPHPIFKGISWAIFVHYVNEKGESKVMEIWPFFSPETIGKFLVDLKSLNPSIPFDKESEEWMEKAQKA